MEGIKFVQYLDCRVSLTIDSFVLSQENAVMILYSLHLMSPHHLALQHADLSANPTETF